MPSIQIQNNIQIRTYRTINWGLCCVGVNAVSTLKEVFESTVIRKIFRLNHDGVIDEFRMLYSKEFPDLCAHVLLVEQRNLRDYYT